MPDGAPGPVLLVYGMLLTGSDAGGEQMALKYSVALQGSYPFRDYIAKAQKIERYGFDEVHVDDDLMFEPFWPSRSCSVTGRPEDVIAPIEAMAAAGVTQLACGHPLGPDFDEALDRLGREVLPHSRR